MTLSELRAQLDALVPHVPPDCSVIAEYWLTLGYHSSADVVSVRYDNTNNTLTLILHGYHNNSVTTNTNASNPTTNAS